METAKVARLVPVDPRYPGVRMWVDGKTRKRVGDITTETRESGQVGARIEIERDDSPFDPDVATGLFDNMAAAMSAIHTLLAARGYTVFDEDGTLITQPIEEGDRVRSFDFDGRDLEGRGAAYIEGVVEGIGIKKDGCPRYRIRVTRRVARGAPIAYPEHVYPPVNGMPALFNGLTHGVHRIME